MQYLTTILEVLLWAVAITLGGAVVFCAICWILIVREITKEFKDMNQRK